MPLIWGGYQGDFSSRNTWPRGLCLVTFPHPWGKFSTLRQPFYNLPGWPGVLPQGQADDMCIIRYIRDCSPFIHGVISWYKKAEVFQRFYKVKSQIYFSYFTLCFTLLSLLATAAKLPTRTENKTPPGCRDMPESESMLGFSVLARY